MKTVKREKVIPEHKKTEEIFIAFDGTEFKSIDKCKDYEHKIAPDLGVIQNVVEDAKNFNGKYSEIYNIRNEIDLEAVIAFRSPRYARAENDYDRFGPGLYIYYENDYSDFYEGYLLNYNNYCDECEKKYSDMVIWNKNRLSAQAYEGLL